MLCKIIGVISGDYFRFRSAAKRAGNYNLPYSVMAWAKAERLRRIYGWSKWEIEVCGD